MTHSSLAPHTQVPLALIWCHRQSLRGSPLTDMTCTSLLIVTPVQPPNSTTICSSGTYVSVWPDRAEGGLPWGMT